MERKLKVGIIDSGVGGDYIKDRILNLNPDLDIYQYKPLYFSPYGNLHISQLFIEADKHMEFLNENGVDIVIVGCMTLSVNCLRYIKYKSKTSKVYDLYTSLPYIDYSRSILLATDNTVKSNMFEGMVNISCHHLANAVERTRSEKLIKGLLRGFLTGYNLEGRDVVVAGCSHYSWIKEEIREVLNPVKIIDPCDVLIEKISTKLRGK